MPDIFFSYSSRDRERVLTVRDALVALGFDVFWDQTVPAGTDWDTWIRRHLQLAKCALVFWSGHSIGSDNVRHEASVAKQQGKLVPVMLESLTVEQFPMGFYTVQGANLCEWSGDPTDARWNALVIEIEAKLPPPLWIRNKLDALETELMSERSLRETTERRDQASRKRMAKETGLLQQKRDDALAELESVRSHLSASEQKLSMREATIAELSQKLTGAEQRLQQRVMDERRDQSSRKQMAKETARLQQKRDDALAELESVRSHLSASEQKLSMREATIAELSQKLTGAEHRLQQQVMEHAESIREISRLKLAISELEQKSDRTSAARSESATSSDRQTAPPASVCPHCGRSGAVDSTLEKIDRRRVTAFSCRDCGHVWRVA